ncbi:hypothetical protein M011DRAFT_466133 [Sporormia fimetaria CBS 119925]|uniref:Uncharacterized protein n=1 Tax=Sporormia fimetaria CBS 119925 TaxID=1340428 RepID=A0A6A6VGS2_9PLEO|nr:hypothetical protein M011DRAFT_466133 [Sporormia fimetaria CBS 119925]
MRVSSTLLLALPAAAVAQDQVPLLDKAKSFWGKITNAVTSAVPAVPIASSPVEAGAAKVAEKVQQRLTMENWREVLTADPTASPPTTQDWVVYIGGDETCFGGFCTNATQAWNQTVALLSVKPNSPNFGFIDCDAEPVFCNSWSIGAPALYFFNIPKPLPDQSAPAPTARYISLRRPANATVADQTERIMKLVVGKEYEQTPPYEGHWHPFTGTLHQYGLAVPVGYILYGFNKMPSWAPMVLISFLSRSFMNKRMNPQPQQQGRAAPAAPAAR